MAAAGESPNDLSQITQHIDVDVGNHGHHYGSTTIHDTAMVVQGNVIVSLFNHEARARHLNGRSRSHSRDRSTGNTANLESRLDGGLQDVASASRGREHRHPVQDADILDILRYDAMNAKRDFSMPQGSYDLEWIWGTSFATWLSEPTLPIWISGKPGSGKSVLTAYLMQDSKTLQRLQSDGSKFKIVHYFFDYRGEKSEANNLIGMLRRILHTVADECHDARSRLQELWKSQRLNLSTTQDVLDCTCELFRSMPELKFCAFINGLDEYKGNVFEAIQTCRVLIRRTGMKMCFVSRPEARVDELLDLHSILRMQDHNEAGMYAYAQAMLLEASVTNLDVKQAITDHVLRTTIQSAEGIMLWFRLVFDELILMANHKSPKGKILRYVRGSPKGLDELYGRILDAIPKDLCNEATLILLLVQKLEDLYFRKLFRFTSPRTRGIVRPDKTKYYAKEARDLDLLTELVRLLSTQYGNSLGLRAITDRLELSTRVKYMLRGLIEVRTADNEKYDTIRLIHKTLPAYLGDTRWITKNLHPGFKQRFPDHIVFRLLVESFQTTVRDERFGPQTLRTCMKGFKPVVRLRSTALSGKNMRILRLLLMVVGPCYFRKHRKVLRTIFSNNSRLSLARKTLLYLAANYENCTGKSSYPIIAPALRSPVGPLLGLPFHYDYLPSLTILRYLVCQDNDQTADIVLALAANLRLYFKQAITSRTLSDSQQQIIGSLLLQQCKLSDFTYKTFYIEDYLDRRVLGSHAFSSESLCVFFLSFAGLDNAMYYVLPLNNFLVMGEVRTTQYVHHPCCRHYKTKHGLLIDWAVLHCGYSTKCEIRAADYHAVLSLCLKTGIDLNQHCYPRGTVLHAIFDVQFLKERCNDKNDWHLKCKFLALMREGINPLIQAKTSKTTSLQAALTLQETLQKLGWRERQQSMKWYVMDDLDLIIPFLEEYSTSKKWSEECLTAAFESGNADSDEDSSSYVYGDGWTDLDSDPGYVSARKGLDRMETIAEDIEEAEP